LWRHVSAKYSHHQANTESKQRCSACRRNLIGTGLTFAASPRVHISSTCKVGQKLGMSLPLLTCSPSEWPSQLLYRRGRKSRRDLWITLYYNIIILRDHRHRNACRGNFITGLTSAASPRVHISSTCKVGQKLGVSLPLLTWSPSAWPSRLLYRRCRKSRRDVWITLYYNVIILRDHRRICGPSLTETSLCGADLYCSILGICVLAPAPMCFKIKCFQYSSSNYPSFITARVASADGQIL
jgi:hypothetical protein